MKCEHLGDLPNFVDQYLWLTDELCCYKVTHGWKIHSYCHTNGFKCNSISSLIGFKIPHFIEPLRYCHLLNFGIESNNICSCLKKPWNIPHFLATYLCEVEFSSVQPKQHIIMDWVQKQIMIIQYLLLRWTLKRFIKIYTFLRILLFCFLENVFLKLKFLLALTCNWLIIFKRTCIYIFFILISNIVKYI